MGIEGLEVIEKEEIHLAIVDIMMPRMDGIRLTMKLREKIDFPVIMLSAKSEEKRIKISGLNIGAEFLTICDEAIYTDGASCEGEFTAQKIP